MKARVRVKKYILFVLFAAILGTAQHLTTTVPTSQPAENNLKNTPTTNPVVVPAPVRTLEQAVAAATATKKDIYLEFTAGWCFYCHVFEKEVLSTPEVKKALENVIFLQLDPDANQALAEKYQISGIPAGLLLKVENKTLKIIDQHIGALTKTQFLHFIKQAKS
jgi:thiol:disulfide interchange protein